MEWLWMEACGRGATLCRHTGLADSSRSVGRIETFYSKSKKEEVQYNYCRKS